MNKRTNKITNNLISICLIIFILGIISCQNKTDVKILPKEEFVKVITDLHYADAIIATKGADASELRDSIPVYYDYVLKKYNISRADFDSSLAYYSDDLKGMMLIYDEVIANINNRIPKKIYEKSIYRIFELALDEAKIISDFQKWFGNAGKELSKRNMPYSINAKDTTEMAAFSGKLKYPGLLMLQANIFIFPDDSSNLLKMAIRINYKDTTYDVAEKKISGKKGIWKEYQTFIKSDSLKKVKSYECFLFQDDSLTGKIHAVAKNVILKQYFSEKDTTELIIIEEPQKRVRDLMNYKKLR